MMEEAEVEEARKACSRRSHVLEMRQQIVGPQAEVPELVSCFFKIQIMTEAEETNFEYRKDKEATFVLGQGDLETTHVRKGPRFEEWGLIAHNSYCQLLQ